MDDNQYKELPFLTNVGFMLTYKCTIACQHCLVNAGPHRTEVMKTEDAFKWLKEIKSYKGSTLGIAFTGGEPFYNINQLKKVSDYAHQSGFIVSVVSNAFWATSKQKALDILKKCSSIHMISVSTDISHLKYIPFSNIKNAVWAAKKTGILYNVALTTESKNSKEYKLIMDDILEITDPEFISTSIVIPAGRAENNNNNNYNYTTEPSAAACSMASFPVIFPNGNVSACIGPPITLPSYNPLYLGNLNNESISDIFDKADNNYVLQAIRTFGPKVIVDLLQKNGFQKILPEKYIKDALCDVCYKLFSNPQTCKIIDNLINEDEYFRNKTKYGRLYYLNESNMIKDTDAIYK